MTTIEAYNFYLQLIRKEVNGFVPPPEWDVFINRAQYEYMMDCLGDPQQYQPGRPIPPINYDSTKRIANALQPFRKVIVIQINSNGIGFYQPDKDFVYGPTAVTIDGYTNPDDCEDPPKIYVNHRIPLDFVTDAEWGDRTVSSIDFPSLEMPIVRLIDHELIEVSPQNIVALQWIYIRKPAVIYTGRTLVAGRYELDPNDPNNVDPEWNDVDMNNIIIRAISYTGINLSNDRLLQYARMKTQEGM